MLQMSASVNANMSFDSMWADVRRLYRDRLDKRPWYASSLTEADVQRWTAQAGVPRAILYDEIAMRLARGFHASELDFTFCDAVINDLFARVIMPAHEPAPDLFWQVYLAFDAGEFYRSNKRHENPIEVYTRHLIAKIVDQANR